MTNKRNGPDYVLKVCNTNKRGDPDIRSYRKFTTLPCMHTTNRITYKFCGIREGMPSPNGRWSVDGSQ